MQTPLTCELRIGKGWQPWGHFIVPENAVTPHRYLLPFQPCQQCVYSLKIRVPVVPFRSGPLELVLKNGEIEVGRKEAPVLGAADVTQREAGADREGRRELLDFD